jgi:hypothetical protein
MDIFDEIGQALSDASEFLERLESADRARRCIWDGQSADGRKHRSQLGYDAFPWEGASDVRTRLVDEIVNEQVALMMQSFLRARVQAAAMETNDTAWANKVTTLLKYVVWNRMKDQVRREMTLAAQWRQAFGCSVTSVMWDQQLRLMEQEVTIEGLAMLLVQPGDPPEQAAGALEVAMEIAMDPAREEEALGVLATISPTSAKGVLRRALMDLRETGKAMLDVPEVFAAEPRITALLPMVDVFFPAMTDDLQRAAWVAHRELLTVEDLRERGNTAGWDTDWIEKAAKTKGQRYETAQRTIGYYDPRNPYREAGSDRDLVEIFHVYRKEADKDGYPSVMCEVVCMGVPKEKGKEERLPYAHGEYPYVVHQREHIARPIIESRGVAEVADTWQQSLKVQMDARTDRTSVTVLPPLIVPARRGATRLRLGPGSQLPSAGRNEQYEWMRTPPYDQGSIEVEKALDLGVSRYFGRINEGIPPQLSVLHQSEIVDGWLLEVRQVCAHLLALCRQYMGDEEVARITGPLPQPWQTNAGEIRGSFDISVEADPRDMNLEMLAEKWKFIETILKYDRAGRVDFSKLVEHAMQGIDPDMAEVVLVPMEVATQKQVLEEQDALAKMVAGIEPVMEPQPGMNYQLRLQVLQESLARNPELQKRVASQADTAALIENRVKFLEFQVQQEQNAQIGRVGTEPVM